MTLAPGTAVTSALDLLAARPLVVCDDPLGLSQLGDLQLPGAGPKLN